MDETVRGALPDPGVAAVVAFLLGQLVVLAALPRRPPLATVIAVETALSLPLVASLVRQSPVLPVVGVFVAVAAATVGVITVAARATDVFWPAALAAVATVVVVAYGIHRYELVRLGLVTGTEPASGADAGAETE